MLNGSLSDVASDKMESSRIKAAGGAEGVGV